jgi:hypothetical protein
MDALTFDCTSIMLGRKPRVDQAQFKTAVVSLFDKNNPHKEGAAPLKTMDFENIEKVRVYGVHVTYYLEGNDLVINDLKNVSLKVDQENNLLVLEGKQSA